MLLLAIPGVGSAYSQDDAHYYLRFNLALSTCLDDAHLIASGDIGMDENSTVSAQMNPIGMRNKADWHAFGHSDRRFRELWLRASVEPDLERRLIKLGQFLHFSGDWESHAGYGVRMGHARDTYRGRDPVQIKQRTPRQLVDIKTKSVRFSRLKIRVSVVRFRPLPPIQRPSNFGGDPPTEHKPVYASRVLKISVR